MELRQIHARFREGFRLAGEVPALHKHQVHLWWVDLEQHRHLECDCQDLLTPVENQRAAAFHDPVQRSNFILQRGILRFLLGTYLGLEPYALQFEQAESGKPKLQAGNRLGLQFNLSHSGGFTLYAFACQSALGVDIQQLRPLEDLQALALRLLSPLEIEQFKANVIGKQQGWFFQAWVRKEACLKTWGSGFQIEPCTISILPDEQRPQVLAIYRQERREAGWRVIDLAAPVGYAAALCWQVIRS